MTTLPALSAAVIESGRLVLRKALDTDCEGGVKVLTDPEIRAYLGGPRRIPRSGSGRRRVRCPGWPGDDGCPDGEVGVRDTRIAERPSRGRRRPAVSSRAGARRGWVPGPGELAGGPV